MADHSGAGHHSSPDDEYAFTPEGAAYEHTDAAVGPVAKFLFWLFVAAVLTHFDFGPTTAYGTSTQDAPLPVGTVPALFADATVTGFPPDSTVHFRAVARTDFVTVDGPDATFDLVNTPPTITIDDLPDEVRSRDLEPGRILPLHLTTSEPVTVVVDVINRKGRTLREVTAEQSSAGSFEMDVSLKRVRGHVTLRVTATDVDGATTVVEAQLQAR